MLYNKCPSGGIGRRPGLKILWEVIPVPVRPRPWAPAKPYEHEFMRLCFFYSVLIDDAHYQTRLLSIKNNYLLNPVSGILMRDK